MKAYRDILSLLLFAHIVYPVLAQNIKPESGLFYYSDNCHTTEIEFFPGNTLCIINTTCDIAIFEAVCGHYYWEGDTLLFYNDHNKFLATHLKVDTQACNPGEVLIHLKTITPFYEPDWRDVIGPQSCIIVAADDYFDVLNLLPGKQQILPWSEVSGYDKLDFHDRGMIGPSILIPDASCMNIEYPVLRQRTLDNPRNYEKLIFTKLIKNKTQITIVENNHTYKKNFKSITRDPFGQ